MGKLIILSGPSGVGKGPMTSAYKAYCEASGIKFVKHVLYNTRKMRAGEKDGETYHFRSLTELNDLYNEKPDRFLRYELTNGDTQMLDKYKLKEQLIDNDSVFLEIVIKKAQKAIEICNDLGYEAKQIFMKPFDEYDFEDMGCVSQNDKDKAVVAAMLNKIINRGTEKRSDQVKRAKKAPQEIADAVSAGVVFHTNHFGEDNRYLWKLLEELVSNPGGYEIFKTFIDFCNLI